MVLRRKWLAIAPVRFSAAVALKYHRISIEGASHLPQEGPALILPKHRAYRDILAEGVVIYKINRRYANYVMKVGLFGVLELMGGVKVVRPKDIRRVESREARKAMIRWARKKNQITLDYLSWLYESGELVVSHPEGMRYQNELGPLQREIIEHLVGFETQSKVSVPVVPVGLEYASYVRPGSRMHFRIGEPMFTRDFAGVDDFMNELVARIGTLSGIEVTRGKPAPVGNPG